MARDVFWIVIGNELIAFTVTMMIILSKVLKIIAINEI